MSLETIIQKLASYNYDALRDIRDLLEHDILEIQKQASDDKQTRRSLGHKQAHVKMRRRGRTAFLDLQYPPEIKDIASLSPPQKDTLLVTLNALITAKKPVAGQRIGNDGTIPIGKGSWQIKKFKRKQGTDAEWIAHYLYLRVYVSNLDGTKRTASIYIGSLNRTDPKPFISAVSSGEITKEDILDRFINEGYEGVKAWRQELDELDEFGVSGDIPDGLPGWARSFINRVS